MAAVTTPPSNCWTAKTPITAFIIVMEMVDGRSMVISLMACALTASGVARLLSPPNQTPPPVFDIKR
ncbi:chloride channel protein [Aquabacterium sp.]|uniref:chloride channel protein n=1 Tax=Aquabacterium sp. TaxID=1872578 RepID=UPI00344E6987